MATPQYCSSWVTMPNDTGEFSLIEHPVVRYTSSDVFSPFFSPLSFVYSTVGMVLVQYGRAKNRNCAKVKNLFLFVCCVQQQLVGELMLATKSTLVTWYTIL